MAIKKIEEIYLYGSEAVSNAAENLQAVAFMEHSGIPFTKLMYNDKEALPQTINALNTWWQDRLEPLTVDNFPFITYVEVHDNIPARFSPVQYLSGIDNIKKIAELYATYGSGTSV